MRISAPPGSFYLWIRRFRLAQGVTDHMRRIFIALIAGGLLLVSGIAASAMSAAEQGQQQQQNDKKPATAPASKLATAPTAEPTPKPTTKTAPKPAPAAPTTCNAQDEPTGDFRGEPQDAESNGQLDQSGVNESKTEANDKTDATDATGNNQD